MSDQNNEVTLHEDSNTAKYALVLLLVVALLALAWWFMSQSSQAPAPVMDTTPPVVESNPLVDLGLSSEVPVPEGVVGAQANEAVGFVDQSVSFTSTQSVSELEAFYRSAIESRGGVIEASMASGEDRTLVSRLSDGRAYVVSMFAGEGETTVNIEVEVDLQSL